MAILVATSVASIFGRRPGPLCTLAALQAIMIGVMQVCAGVGRLGFVSDFIPKSVVNGFINGIALIIILAQAGRFSGIELTERGLFPAPGNWSPGPRAHQLTLYVGEPAFWECSSYAPCCAGSRRPWLWWFWPRVPCCWFPGGQGVHLVGLVPAGLPHPVIPHVGFGDILTMLPVAVGVALVSYVDTTITGRAFAMRGGYRLDPNQELIALGLTNLGTGFFQGFAVGSSHSRTAINDMYGGRSQFAGLLAAIFLAVFLFYFTGMLKYVPVVALSAIIIVAGIRLLRPLELLRIFRTRPASAYISLVTTAAVLIAGLMTGILVSVGLAIILVLHRLARPHETIIRTPKVPGLLIYRFAGPLYFFNAAYFANRVQEVIDSSRPVTVFLINAEAIVDMDENAAEILAELYNDLRSRGIVLGVCGARGHFRRVLDNTGLSSQGVQPLLHPGGGHAGTAPGKRIESTATARRSFGTSPANFQPLEV